MSSKSWDGHCAWRYGRPAHFFVPAFPSLHLEVQEPRGYHVRHMSDDLAGLESGRSAKAHALCCSGKLALSYGELYCIALPGTRGCKRWLPCTSRKGGLLWSALTTVTNEPFDGEETTDELYWTACSHTMDKANIRLKTGALWNVIDRKDQESQALTILLQWLHRMEGPGSP